MLPYGMRKARCSPYGDVSFTPRKERIRPTPREVVEALVEIEEEAPVEHSREFIRRAYRQSLPWPSDGGLWEES